MVVQRTVERLRKRPHEERTALAAGTAVAVAAILFVGWLAFFLHGFSGSASYAPPPQQAPTEGQSSLAPPPTTLQWEASTTTGESTTSTQEY